MGLGSWEVETGEGEGEGEPLDLVASFCLNRSSLSRALVPPAEGDAEGADEEEVLVVIEMGGRVDEGSSDDGGGGGDEEGEEEGPRTGRLSSVRGVVRGEGDLAGMGEGALTVGSGGSVDRERLGETERGFARGCSVSGLRESDKTGAEAGTGAGGGGLLSCSGSSLGGAAMDPFRARREEEEEEEEEGSLRGFVAPTHKGVYPFPILPEGSSTLAGTG
mmetsp:Transcript_34481/g.55789  ORF Transcript_34481/g.55789 Transcript_34481/m.55789 type:complete len:219 (-) Transcript_34481:1168-1824(-)